ncbi:hypothetical protein [Paractinoplanes durhamensis]|uniref:LigA protein n=1 Tax=Paractinoplanes durhamensis TaxID=113563 RepID=A0ABQ3YZP0_9ACTN|nr:hypothetical protein [Actinoplanes durhamensis]GIE03031.1 hypothetical protein Adu01nite_43810 [Actinoplanes durhamensis]
MIQLRTYNASGGLRAIDAADLATAYTTVDPAAGAVFSHEAGSAGPGLRVWIIDGERCRVELRDGGRWHDLVASDATGEAGVTTACIPGTVPLAAVLPRAYGLDVLRMAGDGERLRAAYHWRPVPHWVVDRGDYLLRDIVEAMTERAGDLYMRVKFDGGSDADAPVGLRHLAHLWAFHNATMSGGFGWVLDEYSGSELQAAAAAAAYLELEDIADLVRRLATADRDSGSAETVLNPVYWRVSDTGDGDASAIRDAVRRSLTANPADWGLD